MATGVQDYTLPPRYSNKRSNCGPGEDGVAASYRLESRDLEYTSRPTQLVIIPSPTASALVSLWQRKQDRRSAERRFRVLLGVRRAGPEQSIPRMRIPRQFSAHSCSLNITHTGCIPRWRM